MENLSRFYVSSKEILIFPKNPPLNRPSFIPIVSNWILIGMFPLSWCNE